MKNLFMITLLLVSVLLTGCDTLDSMPEDSTQPVIQNNTTILPENIIQIGDDFEYYPDLADGHFICTVTDIRVVSEETQCPPEDKFTVPWACGYVDGKETIFKYDEWFTEGGAFDLGARLVMVDLTVTNVDAVAWLDNGTFNGDCGYFFDEYAFPTHQIVSLMDLSTVYGSGSDRYYFGLTADYYSREGEFAADDIPDSLGTDNFAIKIMPGETTSFTVGYIIDGGKNGKPVDLSLRWLCIAQGLRWNSVEEGVFIDTKLGGEA